MADPGAFDVLKALAKHGRSVLESRLDGWATQIVPGRSGVRRVSEFMPTRDLTDAELDALYTYSDFAARIVSEIPNERMRQGVTLAGDPEGTLSAAGDRYGVVEKATEAWVWGRLFGLGALYLVVEDGDQSMPLYDDRIRPGSLKNILVIDKRDLQPQTWVRDVADPRFGQPETYLLTTQAAGGMIETPLIHASRLVLFGGVPTNNRRKLHRNGVDDSVLQRVWGVLRDVEENWASSVHILKNLSQAVYKMKDLAKMTAAGRGEDLKERMGLVDATRSVYRAIMLDAEFESFEQVGTANVTAVPLILDKTWQRLAAAAGMPVTKLMGMSPSGLNATGESDLANWHGVVESEGTREALPALRRVFRVIAISEQPEGVIIDDLDVTFPSLWQLDPKESAHLRYQQAQTDSLYIQSGVLLPQDVTLSRFGQGEWSAETVIDIGLAEEMRRVEEERLVGSAQGGAAQPLSTEPR